MLPSYKSRLCLITMEQSGRESFDKAINVRAFFSFSLSRSRGVLAKSRDFKEKKKNLESGEKEFLGKFFSHPVEKHRRREGGRILILICLFSSGDT